MPSACTAETVSGAVSHLGVISSGDTVAGRLLPFGHPAPECAELTAVAVGLAGRLSLSFLSTPVGGSSPPCLAPDGPGVPALPFRPLTASLPHCWKPWAWTLNIIVSVGPISALAERLQLGPRPQACSRVPPAARGPV